MVALILETLCVTSNNGENSVPRLGRRSELARCLDEAWTTNREVSTSSCVSNSIATGGLAPAVAPASRSALPQPDLSLIPGVWFKHRQQTVSPICSSWRGLLLDHHGEFDAYTQFGWFVAVLQGRGAPLGQATRRSPTTRVPRRGLKGIDFRVIQTSCGSLPMRHCVWRDFGLGEPDASPPSQSSARKVYIMAVPATATLVRGQECRKRQTCQGHTSSSLQDGTAPRMRTNHP